MNVSRVACTVHPARDAVGICFVCRSAVCDECTTRIDGVNHCVGCYGRRVSKSRPEDAARAAPRSAPRARGALELGVLVLATWAVLELVLAFT